MTSSQTSKEQKLGPTINRYRLKVTNSDGSVDYYPPKYDATGSDNCQSSSIFIFGDEVYHD